MPAPPPARPQAAPDSEWPAEEPSTAPAVPHLLSEPPEGPEEDTRARLDRQRVREAARAQDAEQRAAELERRLQAAELAQLELQSRALPSPPKTPPPRAPSLSLGDAKWWVMVIGALGGLLAGGLTAYSKIHEAERPTASSAQVDDLRLDVRELRKAQQDRDERDARAARDDAQRTRVLEAVLCVLGVRADGLDCDDARDRVRFEPQPLTGPNKLRGAPQWVTRERWPPARAPPE